MALPSIISLLKKGLLSFRIKATQAAGDQPVDIDHPDECIEIMTGAALPDSVDTVIPYENIEMDNGFADDRLHPRYHQRSKPAFKRR